MDASGVFQVSREGNLLILSGVNTVIWSSNVTVSSRNINPVAKLLDSGNLVVWDDNSTKENPIWQSFDYPGNTLLPGMKLGKDLITGRERHLTSWKSPDDPSIGRYKGWVDTNGYPQIFTSEDLVLYHFRTGPWNGLGFRGLPVEDNDPFYTVQFIVNQMEICYTYKLRSTVVQRVVMTWDGVGMRLTWIKRIQRWVSYIHQVGDTCSGYGTCGPYGICSFKRSPPCSCMEGFEPRVPEEWNNGDWSSGCQREKALKCGISEGDRFKIISGVKFPDTRRSWYNMTMSLGECEMACIMNCSCTAYANLDIRNGGSGCLIWFNELIDVREYDDRQPLYIKMATSGQSSFKRKKAELTVVLSVSSSALLLSVVAYVFRKKKRMPLKKGRGYLVDSFDDHTGVKMENLDELPFISLHQITKATDNFNINKKIGEGGFGSVYKGVLDNEQVIAVKRLSESSKQGVDEFKNELNSIAKLQHRNLVKLLGYCIHGNEMILIYEYMVNGSLDSLLFDETQSSVLDWPQRLGIIHGMARGILYLHQDSRLQIIHRDLKAGNILLDGEMNPKISDFGLARRFVGHDALSKTKKVVGTYGYISPEYAVHGRFSTKSDVFSFGVLVLEIVSGKKNRGFSHEGHRDNLLGHAWRLFKEDKSIELMSACLHNTCVVFEVLRSIHVGLLCVQHHVEDRPTMLSVVLMLISKGTLPPPKQPAFFTEENYHGVEHASSLEDYMITQVYAR
ncbi:hypothetical protein L1887_11114 [Cichorium endivia]|nr:hypothetical protein L1887_11114 [Cichorium endivia]